MDLYTLIYSKESWNKELEKAQLEIDQLRNQFKNLQQSQRINTPENLEESKEQLNRSLNQSHENEEFKNNLRRVGERWNSDKFNQLQSNIEEAQPISFAKKDLDKGMKVKGKQVLSLGYKSLSFFSS